uniref:Uncharacterized protein n=1 Tax=viral metagenome TaxID=1070528 RepID=A0A6C0BUY3_9ZZZZ
MNFFDNLKNDISNSIKNKLICFVKTELPTIIEKSWDNIENSSKTDNSNIMSELEKVINDVKKLSSNVSKLQGSYITAICHTDNIKKKLEDDIILIKNSIEAISKNIESEKENIFLEINEKEKEHKKSIDDEADDSQDEQENEITNKTEKSESSESEEEEEEEEKYKVFAYHGEWNKDSLSWDTSTKVEESFADEDEAIKFYDSLDVSKDETGNEFYKYVGKELYLEEEDCDGSPLKSDWFEVEEEEEEKEKEEEEELEYTEEEIAYNKIDDVMFNKKCLNTEMKNKVNLLEEEEEEDGNFTCGSCGTNFDCKIKKTEYKDNIPDDECSFCGTKFDNKWAEQYKSVNENETSLTYNAEEEEAEEEEAEEEEAEEEEAEEEEAEEEEKEEEAEEEEDVEVEEVTIKGQQYYLEGDLKTNGTLYEVIDNDDIGDVVGEIKNGVIKMK